jgi:probable rRNA maturation factor
MLDLEIAGAEEAGVDASSLALCVEAVLVDLGLDGECAVGVAFVDEEQMRLLNREHRRRDAVTDVLSFPIDGAGDLPAGLERQLGDVVICPAQALRQAIDAAVAPQEELRSLVVHGLLHLAGFDHEHDRGEMLARQDALCRRVDAIGWTP